MPMGDRHSQNSNCTHSFFVICVGLCELGAILDKKVWMIVPTECKVACAVLHRNLILARIREFKKSRLSSKAVVVRPPSVRLVAKKETQRQHRAKHHLFVNARVRPAPLSSVLSS